MGYSLAESFCDRYFHLGLTVDSEGRFLEKWGLRGTGLGELSQPTALALDCAGSVYVADTNNNRVERFDLVSPFGSGCLAPGLWPPATAGPSRRR